MLHTLPLPRVQYKSPSFHFAIDSIKLAATSWQPDLVRLTTLSTVEILNGYAATTSQFDTSVRGR